VASARLGRVVVAVVIISAALAANASAKQYVVDSCHTPDGRPAPATSGRFGWGLTTTGPPVVAKDACAGGGGLIGVSANGVSYRPGDFARWQFDAPPNTAIASYSLRWLGSAWEGRPNDNGSMNAGRAALETVDIGGRSEVVLERSTNREYPPTTVTQTGVALRSLGSLVACIVKQPGDPVCVTSPYDSHELAHAEVTQSTVALEDSSAPSGSASGAAIDNAAWIGPQQFSYTAADRGGGVYRVVLEVDGVPRAQTLADANGGLCRDAIPNNEADHEFFSATPCLSETSGALSFDTASLPEGERTVRVLVEDAAGNQSVIYGPTTKTIVKDLAARGFYFGGQWFNPSLSSPRQLNGVGASEGARLSAAFVTTTGSRKHRRRVETTAKEVGFRAPARVRGRVVNAGGQPIADAVVQRAVQEARGEWRLEGQTKTAPDGTFTLLTVRQRPSRTMKFVYFPFSDSHAYSVSNELELRVRAGVQLRATPRRLRNGQKVRFLGRVFGTLPPGGVTAALQVKNGHRYQTFRQLRVDPAKGGVVRTAYRFRATTATTRYRFRLLIVRQAGLVFERGASPAVSVVVRR
jgi:hypothetical protein